MKAETGWPSGPERIGVDAKKGIKGKLRNTKSRMSKGPRTANQPHGIASWMAIHTTTQTTIWNHLRRVNSDGGTELREFARHKPTLPLGCVRFGDFQLKLPQADQVASVPRKGYETYLLLRMHFHSLCRARGPPAI